MAVTSSITRVMMSPVARESYQRRGRALQRGVEITTQVEDDFLLEGVVEADAQGVERALRKEGRDHDQDVGQEQVGALRDEYVVDHQAGDLRKDEAGERAEDARAERGRAEAGIGPGIFPDAAEGFHYSM